MIDYKRLVASLTDLDVTKRNYDEALRLIELRVDEIWRHICQWHQDELHPARKLGFWVFRNGKDADYKEDSLKGGL